MESHLLQMRGLKHAHGVQNPHTQGSHLLQMRGLKHFDCTAKLPISRSHLLQMRGLKHIDLGNQIKDQVASFTDAWIETKPVSIE